MMADPDGAWLEAGEVARLGDRVCVVDVRPASSHRAERIAGARSVPLREVDACLPALPADVPLIFYCT